MPFIDTRDMSKPSNIDTIHLKPIDVIMSHAIDGRFIPRYFQIELEDNSRQKFKVDAIKQIKELHDHYVFYCSITNYGRQQVVVLTYYTQDHKWYIEV